MLVISVPDWVLSALDRVVWYSYQCNTRACQKTVL